MLRHYSLFDQLLIGIHETLTAILPSQVANRDNPASSVSESAPLTFQEHQESIAQMRINHTGELCAQALYYGQSLTTRDTHLYYILVHAAHEERDHLSWCQARLTTLGGKPSYLNLFWATGAFMIGIIVSLKGRAWNLGFLAETEKQVSRHLEQHLELLSPKDLPTKAILETMHKEEQNHIETAIYHGGRPLPGSIKRLMHFASQFMVKMTRYI